LNTECLEAIFFKGRH